MMHRFECVGGNCVHKVPLNGLNPLDQIQRYRVHTIPPTHKLNLCIICFIKWGPQNHQKYKNLLFYRFTGCMANHAFR